MEDTRLRKCVMFGEFVGHAGSAGGQGKEEMGSFLDHLSAFSIRINQCMITAQDENEYHRVMKHMVELFMMKLIVAERARAAPRREVLVPFCLPLFIYHSRENSRIFEVAADALLNISDILPQISDVGHGKKPLQKRLGFDLITSHIFHLI